MTPKPTPLSVRAQECDWSFIRSVLSQGMAIQQDYAAGKYACYEELSARLDEAARERIAMLTSMATQEKSFDLANKYLRKKLDDNLLEFSQPPNEVDVPPTKTYTVKPGDKMYWRDCNDHIHEGVEPEFKPRKIGWP